MVALTESGTSIGHEKKGYARGLILGFTMAETMLLLVFCLLLVTGAIIAKKEDALKAALGRAESAQLENAQLREDRENLRAQVRYLMEQSTGHKMPDEDWRKLVLAKEAVEQLEKTGLTVEEAVEFAEATIAVRDNNLSAKTVQELVSADKRAATAQRQVAELKAQLADAKAQSKIAPPILRFSEAEGYSFQVGSAELAPSFKAQLEGDISLQIASIVDEYGVDVIEVVGHTDEQRMSKQSNMDFEVSRVLAGQDRVSKMEPGDNAGLGLARAISVTTVLRTIPEFKNLNILPMSGGQLILPDDRMTDGAQAGDAPARRRIEIRVRKSKHKLEADGAALEAGKDD